MNKRVRDKNYLRYSPYYLPNTGIGGSHLYSLGDTLKKAINGENAGALGAAAGNIAGGLIGGGYSSTAGSLLSAASGLASNIPGPWGAGLGAGLGVASGAVNALFGSKVDQEKLNAATQGTNYLNSFKSNASNFDEIQGPVAQAAVEDAYSGGLFNKGDAARKNAALKRERLRAQDFAEASVDNNINNIFDDQMNTLLANYALGGPLHTHGSDWTNGVTLIDAGGTHEDNPLEGVPMGMAEDGQPNLVEEGEAIFNDYVFSNRIKVPDAIRQKYKLRGTKDMTFADAARKASKESEERPNDPISKRGLADIMTKLQSEQETIKQEEQMKRNQNTYLALGGHKFSGKNGSSKMTSMLPGPGISPQYLPTNMFVRPQGLTGLGLYDDSNIVLGSSMGNQVPSPGIIPNFGATGKVRNVTDFLPTQAENSYILSEDPTAINPDRPPVRSTNPPKSSSWLPGLRFAPALGAGISVFSDLMGWSNTPDYSNANAVLNAANSIGDVSYTPIGDYLKEARMDRLFGANMLAGQAGATRRGLMNNSGGNRGMANAGLLAADYGAQQQLGNLYRQAEEFKASQYERAKNFNRTTNLANVENSMKAQMANKDIARVRVDAAARAAALRDAIDARIGTAKSANLTNFLDNVGNIGREAYTMNMIASNPALYYTIDRGTGEVTYKNGYHNLSPSMKAAVDASIESDLKKHKFGGSITRMRRRR